MLFKGLSGKSRAKIFPGISVCPSAGLFLESLEIRCLLSAIDVELMAVSAVSAGDECDDLSTLGNQISTVDSGQAFYVEAWIKNADSSLNGIKDGYIDIDFSAEPGLVTAAAITNANHGSIYDQYQNGTINNTTMLVDDFGGGCLDSETSWGVGGWVRLGYIRFVAASGADGTVDFISKAAGNQFTRCVDGDISWDDVEFDNPRLSVDVIDMAALPEISISDAQVTEEGDSGTTILNFTVSLSSAGSSAVTVNYATADGTATELSGDYVPANGSLTFEPGASLTQTVAISVNGDTEFEQDETFLVKLSGAVNATIATSQATGTIQNDDFPALSISDVTVAENNEAGTAIFTVTLTQASPFEVTVGYATADGIATLADGDYVTTTGTLSFKPGESLTQTVEIPVNGDTKFEQDETFFVNLSSAVNATIATGQATGTIGNDDTVPTIEILPVTTVEGNSGTIAFGFKVNLSNASYLPVSVDYATVDGTATLADGDYTAVAGTLSFAPGGSLSQTKTVNVNGDTKFEPDETFFVNLSNAVNATIAADQATGTIENDDAVPTINIYGVSLSEGNSGTTDFEFTVSLSNASYLPVSVSYMTADGAYDNAATEPGDYVSTGGSLTFEPGASLTQTVAVSVNGDTNFEGDEDFRMNLTGPAGGVIGRSQAVCTILNDDFRTLSITDVSQFEGAAGYSYMAFTVTLSPASDKTVQVNYAAANGTATLADNDYESVSGMATFKAGVTTKTISVQVNGDTKVEADETFFLNLSNPTGGAVILDGQGVGTIKNDDGGAVAVELEVAPLAIAVNEGGSNNFTVRLSAAPAGNVTVNIAAQAGGDVDLQANLTALNFTTTNWSQPQTVTVTAAQDDDTAGGSAGFIVSAAGMAGKTVTATEIDDDTTTPPSDDNIAPTIGSLIASPETITAGDNFTLTAEGVNDSDGTVVAVAFYRDINGNSILETGTDVLLGIDTNGTDGWNWTGSSSGFGAATTINCWSKAQDNDGAWSSEVTAAVTVAASTPPPGNSNPTIGALVDSPDPVVWGDGLGLVANNVNDSDGTVVAVEFYCDANGNGILETGIDELLGIDTNGNDGWRWTGLAEGCPVGIARYFARAQDDDGAWSSAVITLGTVQAPDNIAPTIDYLRASPEMVTAGDNFTLIAEGVSDSDGTVVAVEFYCDVDSNGILEAGTDTLLGIDTNGANGWDWTGSSDSFDATTIINCLSRAQDNDGTWSSEVTAAVTVVASTPPPGNNKPTIGPLADSPDPVMQGAIINLTVSGVADSDGTVAAVKFYRDANGNGILESVDTLLGSGTADGTGSWSWSGVINGGPVGLVRYFARAQDNDGTWSSAVTTLGIVQESENIAPTIAAFNASPETITAGDNFTLIAQGVNDSDGVAIAVEFYHDVNGNGVLETGIDELFGIDTNGADGWRWIGSSIGFETATTINCLARVQDDNGAWSNEAVAVITMAPSQGYMDSFDGSKKVNFVDSDGDIVTVSLSGPGTGIIYYPGDSPCDAGTIVLSGTTDKSSLTITTKGKGAETAVDKIIVNGSLKAINALTTDLQNSIVVSGSIADVKLDDILAGSSISTAIASASGTRFKADNIADDVSIDIFGLLKQFQSNTFAGGTLTADTIGQVKVNSQTLGADIVSRIGEIKTVRSYGDIAGDIISNTSISSITSKGEFTGAIRSHADLGNISFDNISNALISTYGNIKKVSSKRDILDTWILAGYDVGADAQLAGAADDILNPAGGDIGFIQTGRYGNFNGSFAMAGLQPYYNQSTSAWTIAPQGQQVMAGSGKIGKALLGQVFQGDPADPYGLFAASTIGSVRVTEVLSASGAGDFQQKATWM
jgi:hypothetical protein